MAETRYSKDHEWVRVDGDVATVGISEHAQEQLGDVVFVELPDPGQRLERKDAMAVIESVKAASDVYAPVSGEVVEVNEAVGNDPAMVNSGAEAEGWLCKIKLGNPAEVEEMMDGNAYQIFLETLS